MIINEADTYHFIVSSSKRHSTIIYTISEMSTIQSGQLEMYVYSQYQKTQVHGHSDYQHMYTNYDNTLMQK